MKTISVRELHMHTGRYVRQGAEEKMVVTDRGRSVAILMPMDRDVAGAPLPKRESFIRRLPHLNVDSTTLVSEDRDRP
jgi:antitoxin (DNA-binding transcriptional repressor) of toxin-antitoxin stability system